MLKNFDDLPEQFKNDDVFLYYNILKKKKVSLFFKRIFDFVVSLLMLIVISPILIIIGLLIKIDSKGPIIFKQERITQYGKRFYIYKFRTMYSGSEYGSQVTLKNDSRITCIGLFLRKFRLDELLQLINILKGEMSFVGARPEVKKYVDCYSDEMYATLLLPAGVTSLASIKYKDEDRLLASADDADDVYVNEILEQKMEYNLEYIKEFLFWKDIQIMFATVTAVLKKEPVQNESFNYRKEKKPVERM